MRAYISLILDVLRELFQLVYMVFQTHVRFRISRLRRQGRDEEAEAVIAGVVIRWTRRLLDGLRCEVRVEGLEHVPAQGPYLIMANHQSKYDIPVLVGYLGVISGFLAKRELFRLPGLAFWMQQIGCVPLNRKDVSGSIQVLASLGAELKASGRTLILFPEGTRSRDPEGAIGPLRQGSLRLATDNEIPILPVVLDGTRLLDSKQALLRTSGGGRYVRVRVLPLLNPGNLNGPQRKQLAEKLKNDLVSNHAQIRVNWDKPSPGRPTEAAG